MVQTLSERVWKRISDPGAAGSCWLKDTGGGVVSINRAARDFGDTINVGSAEESDAGLDERNGIQIRATEESLSLSANNSYEVFYALLVEATSIDTQAELVFDSGPSGIGTARASLTEPIPTAFGETPTERFEALCGWIFPYNINPSIVQTEVANGGTVTHQGDLAVISAGTNAAGEARITTIRSSRYIPGFGGMVRFTAIFDTPQENSTQIIGLGNGTDGWFFGYDGLQFGILRRRAGVDDWSYFDDWNGETIQQFNPQTGNVYEIRYQWLGFGAQFFYIEDFFGRTANVHTIRYANAFTETSISNPNLPLEAEVVNTGNTTAIELKTASAIAGIHGDVFNDAISVNAADDFVNTVAPGSQVPILAFRMGATYLLKANRLFAQALRLSFATEGVNPVTFRFFTGGTLTGGAWNYINEQSSPLESNKTITSYTPGDKIGTFGLGRASNTTVDLIASNFRLYAGQQIVVTAQTVANASSIVFGFNWKVFV